MTSCENCTLPESLLEQFAEQGLGILPELVRVVINTAMQAERENYLGMAAYEQTDTRCGHTNGYKPKMYATQRFQPYNMSRLNRLQSAITPGSGMTSLPISGNINSWYWNGSSRTGSGMVH